MRIDSRSGGVCKRFAVCKAVPPKGASQGVIQANPGQQAQLLPRPPRARNVALWSLAGRCGPGNPDRRPAQTGDFLGEVRDGDGFFAADVVGPCVLAVDEELPQPGRQVGGVEVGTNGRAVAGNLNGLAGKTIAEEIADGEVRVQGQVRADESEAAGDGDLHARILAMAHAQHFRDAFTFVIGEVRVEVVRSPGEVLVDVSHVSGLFAVNSARGGEEHPTGAGVPGEGQSPACAPDDDVEHLFGINLIARARAGVAA